jgi:hypothetical protein
MKGCLATASSRLSTSRVSTASGSDAASSALAENATASASSSEIQALERVAMAEEQWSGSDLPRREGERHGAVQQGGTVHGV